MNSKLKKVVAASALLFSGALHAAVDVTFDKDLELLVMNGEAVGFSASNPDKVKLNDGPNQLVVRVAKLISHNGEYKKFRSEPVVITFNAAETEFVISPTRQITRDQQVNGFDKQPAVQIVENGRMFADFHQGVLPRGSGMMRDYEKELKNYNVAKGYTLPESKPQLLLEKTTIEPVMPKVEVNIPEGNALILLQADFLRLPAQQREAFLSWAQQQ